MKVRLNKKVEIESFAIVPQILLFLFSLELLLSTVIFFMGLSITWFFFCISLFLAAAVSALINKKIPWAEAMICLMFVIMTSIILGEIYDFSWDGNAYHKLAIGLLKNNWNPIMRKPDLDITEGEGIKSFGNNIWVETYCKVTWIFGASIYALTGNIETGKSYTVIGIVCAFCLTFYYMKKRDRNKTQALMMAAAASLNPIAIQQMTSFYIDGFLHTILIILVISLLMLADKDHFDKTEAWSFVSASMLICGNIKFTGLFYGGVFCIAFYLYDSIREIRKGKGWFNKALKNAVIFGAIGLVTVVWAGTTAYVTNMIRHNNPLYPLIGPGKVDIITGNSPFKDENHVENLLISLFSKVDSFTYSSGEIPTLKIPFTFSLREIYVMHNVDVRLSGFGIIFGGLFIVSVSILVIWLWRGKDQEKDMMLLILTVCTGLMFGMKESWWARYSPYIYIIILVTLYILLKQMGKMLRRLAMIFFVAIMFNSTVPLAFIPINMINSQYVNEYFHELKKIGKVEICNKDFEGVYFNFKDHGINYKVNNQLIEEKDVYMTNYQDTYWREAR